MNKLTLIFLLVLTTVANAEVIATIDKSNYSINETIEFTIESDDLNSSTPDLSPLQAYFTVSGTTRSQSTTIINGTRSDKKKWVAQLKARKMGTLIIPAIEVGGIRTKQIPLTITKAAAATSNDDFYFNISISKKEAYVQEEILLTMKFYIKRNLMDGSFSEPKGDGLVFTRIGKDKQSEKVVNGRRQIELERKYIVRANKSGKVTIDSFVFNGILGTMRGFGRGKSISITSDPTELNIKQIPAKMVNQYWLPAESISLIQNIEKKQEYKVGEPITRTITLTALGLSQNQIEDLKISDIKGAKIYQDKVDVKEKLIGSKQSTQKEINYIIIPESEGKLTIPEIKLSWFNTKTNKKEISVIKEITLDIKPNSQITQITKEKKKKPKADKARNKKIVKESINKKDIVVSTEHTETSSIWEILAIIFILLWLSTILVVVWLLKKYKNISRNNINESDASNLEVKDKLNNSDIFKKLSSVNKKDKQKALIDWWNLNNTKKVTNLSQISKLIKDKDTASNLEKLELSVYTAENNEPTNNWISDIKSGKLDKKTSNKQGKTLPELW